MPSGGLRKGAGRPRGKVPTRAVRLPINIINALESGKFPAPLPLYLSKVSAGTPTPGEDDIAEMINLHSYLIKHPTDTFLVQANGQSMLGAGIHENDILVVDRSLPAANGKVVIAVVDGQMTVKRLQKNNGKTILQAENPKFKSIEINDNNDVHIWGVVTNVIHRV